MDAQLQTLEVRTTTAPQYSAVLMALRRSLEAYKTNKPVSRLH
ncbi:hypothetical protein [Hymenobacter translucens]|nr:hypothetical protein [Hymenobacter translucens]